MTRTHGPGQTEREWQFAALDTRPVARWLAEATVPGFTLTPREITHIHDTYHDTPDWRVNRAGYTCRVRRNTSGQEVTLKSMAEAVDGLRQRQEIDEALPGDVPGDLRTLTGPAGQALRIVAGNRTLRQLFVIETTRQLYDLSDPGGIIGEIALDDTAIPVHGEDHPVRLARVEVEVQSLERARPFVDTLRQAASLTAATTSKFEAALIATGQLPTHPHNALGPTDLSPGMSAHDYSLAILRKRFYALVANEPGTRLGHDPKYLHDMRVATRRIRAALAAFKQYLPPPARELAPEMRWLTRTLGDVRDLDVQLDNLQDWAKDLHPLPPSALDSLQAHLRQQREEARQHMLSELDSERFDTLLQRFAHAIDGQHSNPGPNGAEPIATVLPRLLTRRYRRFRNGARRIHPGSPPAEYHQLRIEAKKLRYAAEFAAPVLGRPAQEFATRVTAIQDLLGLHQDAEVVTQRLLSLTHHSSASLTPTTLVAIGIIIQRQATHAQELRDRFEPTCHPIHKRTWKPLRQAWQ